MFFLTVARLTKKINKNINFKLNIYNILLIIHLKKTILTLNNTRTGE